MEDKDDSKKMFKGTIHKKDKSNCKLLHFDEFITIMVGLFFISICLKKQTKNN